MTGRSNGDRYSHAPRSRPISVEPDPSCSGDRLPAFKRLSVEWLGASVSRAPLHACFMAQARLVGLIEASW